MKCSGTLHNFANPATSAGLANASDYVFGALFKVRWRG